MDPAEVARALFTAGVIVGEARDRLKGLSSLQSSVDLACEDARLLKAALRVRGDRRASMSDQHSAEAAPVLLDQLRRELRWLYALQEVSTERRRDRL